MDRKGKVYCGIVKGHNDMETYKWTEYEKDQFHLLYFADNEGKECVRYKFDILKDSVKFPVEIQDSLTEFIKNVIAFEKGELKSNAIAIA